MSAATAEMAGVELQTNAPAVGVYRNVSFAEYASWNACNWHSLEPYRKSAKHGRNAELRPEDATDTQVFHAAFHAAILEPELFNRDYVVMPRFDGHPNSNAHKDAKREWQLANASKVHLIADEMVELLAMSDAVRRHPVSSAILAGKGRSELSIVWRDKKSGILMKGRIDRICRVKMGIIDPGSSRPDEDVIVLADFKGTRNIEPRLFERDRAKYAYHGQIAMYTDGAMEHDPAPLLPMIIAVENSADYDVVPYRLDGDPLEEGRKLYRSLLNLSLSCRRTKRWPGISDHVIPCEIAQWEKVPSIED